MMDLSFWHTNSKNFTVDLFGFNPCYDGFVFLTSICICTWSWNYLFQSLLWWICLFDRSRIIDCSRLSVFQSLLWWICLFDLNQFNRQNLTKLVSILVMMDLSFWPLTILLIVFLHMGFNPCYDGFVFLTFHENSIRKDFTSFNPCYDGFVFLTVGPPVASTNVTSFNPCYDGFVFLTALFLLVLLHLDLCFNPCYDGFVFLTATRTG